ncbi:MAG: hypothetical protein ACKOD3_09585 [Phenylobacterium sp.]
MQIQANQGPGQMLSALLGKAGGVGATGPAGAQPPQGGPGGAGPTGGPQGQKGPPPGQAGGRLTSGTMSGLLSAQAIGPDKLGDGADPVSKLMQAADTDGNGGLSTEELRSMLGDEAPDDISESLAKIDRDEDGELSAEEIGGALNEMRRGGPEGARSASAPSPPQAVGGLQNLLTATVPGDAEDKLGWWMTAA